MRFFRNLGFNVLLSPPTNEEIIRLAQQTCPGGNLLPGEATPRPHGMAGGTGRGLYLHALCPYHEARVLPCGAQLWLRLYADRAPAGGQRSESGAAGITLFSPVFDLDFGQEAMASAMLGSGKQLGIPKPRCLPALLSGAKSGAAAYRGSGETGGGNCWRPLGRTIRCWCSLPGTTAFPTRCSTWESPGCCWSAGIRSSPCPICPPTTWICRRTTPICTGPLVSTSCPGPSSWPIIQTCMPSI